MSDTPDQQSAPEAVNPVEAAQRRRRIPVWAVALFPALLVWAIIYVNGVTEPPASANTPEAMGQQIYAKSCGGCHGPTGTGASGPAFVGGDLDKVFPDYKEQIKWVDLGSSNWTKVTGSDTFGEDLKKPASPSAGMPGFGPGGTDGSLSCTDIALVVNYERTQLAGMDPDDELTTLTEQIAAGQTPSDVPGCTS